MDSMVSDIDAEIARREGAVAPDAQPSAQPENQPALADIDAEIANRQPPPDDSVWGMIKGFGSGLKSGVADAGRHGYIADRNLQQGVAQGTDPQPAAYGKSLGQLSLTDDAGNGYFKDETGAMTKFDPAHHVVMNDPDTGKPMIFGRSDATNESALKGAARTINSGMLVGPVSGPASAVTLPIGPLPGGVLAANRAANATQDLASLDRLNINVPPGSFSSTPIRGTAKALSEIPLVGSPVLKGLETSYQDLARASQDVAGRLSTVTQHDVAGAGMQRGLDRFRSAGVAQLEPPILEGMGINPRGPVQAADVMSAAANQRAVTAAPVRAENYAQTPQFADRGTAQTSRGVSVPAAQSRQQTLLARRGAEDLSDNEVQRLVRAPASETSFATRAEALYESANRQLPDHMRVNVPVGAVNTQGAFQRIAQTEASTGITTGMMTGRFGGMANMVQDNNNLTLPVLRSMRTEIGRALSNRDLYDTNLDTQQLKTIYGAISRDIEGGYLDVANRAHLATKSGSYWPESVAADTARAADAALYQYRRADRYFRQGIDRMDRFLNVVGADSPELAAKRMVAAFQGGGKGDIGLARSALGALQPEQRNDFAGLVLRHMGDPLPSAKGIVQETGISGSTFVTNWNKMDPRVRGLLFGGEHEQAINDLYRSANRLASVEAMANTSRSGTNAMNIGAVSGGLMALVGAKTLGFAAVAAPVTAGGGLMGVSYLLSRPAYARWATSYLNLKAAAAHAPQRMTPVLAAHLNRFAQMARFDPQLAQIGSALAAENGIAQRDGQGRTQGH